MNPNLVQSVDMISSCCWVNTISVQMITSTQVRTPAQIGLGIQLADYTIHKPQNAIRSATCFIPLWVPVPPLVRLRITCWSRDTKNIWMIALLEKWTLSLSLLTVIQCGWLLPYITSRSVRFRRSPPRVRTRNLYIPVFRNRQRNRFGSDPSVSGSALTSTKFRRKRSSSPS